MDPSAQTTVTPEKKLRVLQNSRLSFVYSLFGLWPVIGLPFVIGALVLASRARMKSGTWINPGRRHLKAALVISVLGLFISLISIFIILSGGETFFTESCSTGGGGG